VDFINKINKKFTIAATLLFLGAISVYGAEQVVAVPQYGYVGIKCKDKKPNFEKVKFVGFTFLSHVGSNEPVPGCVWEPPVHQEFNTGNFILDLPGRCIWGGGPGAAVIVTAKGFSLSTSQNGEQELFFDGFGEPGTAIGSLSKSENFSSCNEPGPEQEGTVFNVKFNWKTITPLVLKGESDRKQYPAIFVNNASEQVFRLLPVH
jgi:hypothetical protein